MCFEIGTEKSCSMIPAKSWDWCFKSTLTNAFEIAEYNQHGTIDWMPAHAAATQPAQWRDDDLGPMAVPLHGVRKSQGEGGIPSPMGCPGPIRNKTPVCCQAGVFDR